MSTPTTDEERWWEAQSILDRSPSPTADARLRGARRRRWLLVLGIALLAVGTGSVLAGLLVGRGSGGDADVPTWRVVVGFTVSGLALISMAAAVVFQIRATRRVRGWSSPLHVLSRRQRKELLRQVRGQEPVVPERLGLARHLAEVLLVQRLALLAQAGLVINFVGLWIAGGEPYRLALAAGLACVWLVAGVFVRRDTRRARRFLDTHHPPVAPSA